MTAATPLDGRTRAVVLETLLEQNPTGLIVAINARGFFIPMPPSVPCGARQLIQGHTSALELVVANEGQLIIDTWVRAQEQGAACAEVHLLGAPTKPVTLHFVDVQAQHGCYLGLFFGVEDHVRPERARSTMRPRYTVMRKSIRAIITATDEMLPKVLGWSREEVVGRRSLELVHPDDHPMSIANWMDMLATPGEARRVKVRHLHKDGSWVWVEFTNYNRLDDSADPHVVTEIVDVSAEMAALEALRASEYTLRRLAEALPLGVLQIDRQGKVVYGNARAEHILGTAAGQGAASWLTAVREPDRTALTEAISKALAGGGDADREVDVDGANGSRRCHVRLRALASEKEGITGAIICIEDITTDVHLREELRQRATYDALTGCLNRASIITALGRELEQLGRGGAGVEGLGLLFIDLDHFKEINDELGHADGDTTLTTVAKRIVSVLRADDRVGRLGGDEFLVLCPRMATAADALVVAERIAEAIARPLRLSTRELVPSASIGVSWTAATSESPDALIAHADRAMYQSKRGRRGAPVLAPPALHAEGKMDQISD